MSGQVIKAWNPTTSQWEPVLIGAQGPPGESAQREVRSDWQSPYSYIGIAAVSTPESSLSWKITRITISGSTITSAVATSVAWTDRYTATYI